MMIGDGTNTWHHFSIGHEQCVMLSAAKHLFQSLEVWHAAHGCAIKGTRRYHRVTPSLQATGWLRPAKQHSLPFASIIGQPGICTDGPSPPW